MTLPVSRLVRVSVNLSPLAAPTRTFGVLMVAGDSDVITGLERFREYSGVEEIATQFGTESPEYKAAALYFGQTPQPRTMMIGRWITAATNGQLLGGILTPSEATVTPLSPWSSVTDGAFEITVDELPVSVSALNFSGAANLNAVADIIDTALLTASCVWNGEQFIIASNSTGGGEHSTGTISCTTNPSAGKQATNTIQVLANPAPGDTFQLNSTIVTFVDSSPAANEVLIGLDPIETLTNFLTLLQESSDSNLSLMTYNALGDTITATAREFGEVGNTYSFAATGTGITIGALAPGGGQNPDTLIINGQTFTFVDSTVPPATDNILVGPTAADTAVNIQAKLSSSVIPAVAQAQYSVEGVVITVIYVDLGPVGNAFTLAQTGVSMTLSGPNLTGGLVGSSVGFATSPATGTDISATLKLTAATAIAPVPGYNAETPVECAAVLTEVSAKWYGLMFAAETLPTNEESLEVSTLIEAQGTKRIYGVTITDTAVLSNLVTSDLASLMKGAGYLRSFCQYSPNQSAIASFFGRAFTVNFLANNSTINLMYKQEPSVTPSSLSTTQANTLQTKRCNVFTPYSNDTSIIQYGVMSGPAWYDEIHGVDWLQDGIQTACYNLMYLSPTKIPQTDAGVNQFVNAISSVCDQAVANNFAGPGIWTSAGFGQLLTGQYLKAGYYVYAQPIALQSQSDRDARIGPPIQVAIKLTGAIQEIDVIISVNR